MTETATQEGTMFTDEPIDARMWDSERRDSPFSTVADPNEDDYCEGCDSEVHYSDENPNGRCRCDGAGGYEATPNSIAREGCDRCYCGCKYWEADRCIDCGTTIGECLRDPEWVAENRS